MKRIFITGGLLIDTVFLMAQDTVRHTGADYDPDQNKVIPDKVLEIGIPLVILFAMLNVIVSVLKNKAENNLKLKMIEKGVSEESLVKMFQESNAITRLQPLKWFLFAMATGLSLVVIHFSKSLLVNQSGYLAIGIILLFNAIAFLIYHKQLSQKI